MKKVLQTLVVVITIAAISSFDTRQRETQSEEVFTKKEPVRATTEKHLPLKDTLIFPALAVNARDLLNVIKEAKDDGGKYKRLIFQFYQKKTASNRDTFLLACHIVKRSRASLKQPRFDLLKVALDLPIYKDSASGPEQLILPQLELTKKEFEKLGINMDSGPINFLPRDTTIGTNRYVKYSVECAGCKQQLTATELNPSPPAKPK